MSNDSCNHNDHGHLHIFIIMFWMFWTIIICTVDFSGTESKTKTKVFQLEIEQASLKSANRKLDDRILDLENQIAIMKRDAR